MSEVIEFETKQDFNDYYKEHQKELDELKTKELNDKFKIEGFKIIRNKGKIAFRKIKETKTKNESSESENSEIQKTVSDILNEVNNKCDNSFQKNMCDILINLKQKLNDEFDNIIKEMKEQE